MLGVIINELKKPYKTLVTNIQNDLFDIGADIATPIGSSAPKKANIIRINKDYVLFLEKEIDKINSKLLPLNSFILPGGSNSSALIHLASDYDVSSVMLNATDQKNNNVRKNRDWEQMKGRAVT